VSRRKPRPATTDENRENQLVSMTLDLAEKQLLEGTASSQVMTHFLKIGSTRERLERARLEREVELLEAKVESLASQADIKVLYQEALQAMRGYAGQEPIEEFDEYYDEEGDWD